MSQNDLGTIPHKSSLKSMYYNILRNHLNVYCPKTSPLNKFITSQGNKETEKGFKEKLKATHLYCIFVKLFRQFSQLLPSLTGVGKLLQPVQLFHFGNRIWLLFYDLYDLEAAQARNQQSIVGLGPVTAHNLDRQCSCPNPEKHTERQYYKCSIWQKRNSPQE